MYRYIIYARKSTESEDRQVLSIDSQIVELLSFAAKQNLNIVSIYQEAQSARFPGRPVFGKMVKKIREHHNTGVLCWHLDRLARNLQDAATLTQLLQEGVISEIRTPRATYGSTSMDLFVTGLDFLIAKKYVDDLSENTKRGLRTKVMLGWRPGRAPLGYLNDISKKVIVRDAIRFPIVQRIWQDVLYNNSSPRRVWQTANREWGLTGRPFRNAERQNCSLTCIYEILHNPFYYGLIKYGNEYYPGAHEPMVSKAEFDRMQQLLASRHRPRPKRLYFAYRGLLRCGECGAGITAEHKVNHSGYHYTYYHCTKRKPGVPCQQKSIEEKRLENSFSQYLEQVDKNTTSQKRNGSDLSALKSMFDGGSQIERRNILEKLNVRYLLMNQRLVVKTRFGNIPKS